MRRLLIAATLLLAAAAYGQDLAEKIDVTLVNVDVTVTSKNHSVNGLTRDDFEVFEDGVPQAITHFYAIESAPAVMKAADVVSSAPPPTVDERFRRRVLVVVDYVHTPQIERNRALERLEQFIDDRFTAGEYEWSIAIAGMDLRLILPLTSDKERIHAALEAMRHRTRWQVSSDASFQSLDIRLPTTSNEAILDPTFTYFSFRAVVFETRAHAPHDEPTNHGELTHTALIRLTPGTIHTVVVAIHDQITDAIGVVKQRIDFQEREKNP